MLAYEDNELAALEKQAILLANMYDEIPPNAVEAARMAVKFLNCGQEGEQDEPGPRLYSFGKDADLIFAAFQQTHGIDLQSSDLHWWKFMALFMDLGADTAFCNLIGLRKRVKTGKATKEERQAARDLGDAFNVPELDTRSLEELEQEARFMQLIGAG